MALADSNLERSYQQQVDILFNLLLTIERPCPKYMGIPCIVAMSKKVAGHRFAASRKSQK